MNAPLYNTEILRLAASIPHHDRLAEPHGTAERRSPVCGSRVVVDVTLGPDGRVDGVGIVARACALGQASSNMLASGIMGRTPRELADARDALTAWLEAGTGEPPAWPGLHLFAPALGYSARHPSIRLAFEAAAEAAGRADAERAGEG